MGLNNVRGCMYFPAQAYNNWQIWADYTPQEIERDMSLASTLNLNAIRVFLSYEWWAREAFRFREGKTGGNAHISNFHHLLNTAGNNGIAVMPVFFESIGDDPMSGLPVSNGELDVEAGLNLSSLNDNDIHTSFAMHSPSRSQVMGPRRWGMPRQSLPAGDDGRYFGSPRHFVRRFTNEFGSHPDVLAFEVMNEPAWGDFPRADFVIDMCEEIRDVDPSVPLTVGAKNFQVAQEYHGRVTGGLDIFQYHQNLPADADAAQQAFARARDIKESFGVPVWLTEWQRLRQEPPSRFLPHYQNMAGLVKNAHASNQIDGDFFWGLQLKPAYIEKPRRDGRVNGVFHADGTVFKRGDANAIAGVNLDTQERREYPGWMEAGLDTFPFPDPSTGEQSAVSGLSRSVIGIVGGAVLAREVRRRM